MARDRSGGVGQEGRKLRDRRGETLFIDARKLGFMIDRTHRAFKDEEIQKIVSAYHNWRGDGDGQYADEPGFCKAAKLDEIRKHQFILTPGRFIEQPDDSLDSEAFEELMEGFTAELEAQFSASNTLDSRIKSSLRNLGYNLT